MGPFTKAGADGVGTRWVVYTDTCADLETGSIKYGLTGGKGAIAAVDPDLSQDIAAVMDPGGYPWAAFVDPATDPPTLRVAARIDDEWTTVDLAAGFFHAPGMAFDARGILHVAAVDPAYGVRDFAWDGAGVRARGVAAGSLRGPCR
ncbi:MAG: hypothetical protein M5R36_19905 [Deltaproteobacteria bacterium]|nr:hypothetical protein [Deltaproteobacteria bacterium]